MGSILVKFLQTCVLLCAVLLPARAQTVDKSMCPRQPIRFAHYEMGTLYVQGRGGIDEDILQELVKRSNCAFSISVLPRARSWYELEAGSLDMLASGVPTAERDKYAWFAPYLADKKFVLLGPKVPPHINTMDQFIASSKLMMGGVRSFKYSPMYDALTERLGATDRMEQVGDIDTLYRMFAHGASMPPSLHPWLIGIIWNAIHRREKFALWIGTQAVRPFPLWPYREKLSRPNKRDNGKH